MPDALAPRKVFENQMDQGLTNFTQPSLTADERILWVVAVAGTQIQRLYYNDTLHQFDNPAVEPHVNGGGGSITTTPAVNYNGTVIYFASNMVSAADIFRSSRASAALDFNTPEAITSFGSNAEERPGTTNMAGDRMVLTLGSDDESDLYESVVTGSSWQSPTRLDELSTTKEESHPTLSGDGLTVVFASNRNGNGDLYIARRRSLATPFEVPEPITELNTSDGEADPWLSPNGRVIYFTRVSTGVTRLLRAETSP